MKAPVFFIHGIVRGTGGTAQLPVLNSAEVRALNYRDMACLISGPFPAGPAEGTSALADMLTMHHSVLEQAMDRARAVLPVKMGAKFTSDGQVVDLMERAYTEFSKRLDVLEDRIEADLTAYWQDLDGMIKGIAAVDGEITLLRERIQGRPANETLEERIRVGSAIKDRVEKRRVKAQSLILERLGKEVCRSRVLELADDRIVLSCALLIDRKKLQGFEKALDEVNSILEEKVRLRYVSPLPPYSFAMLEVKEAEYEEVLRAKSLFGLGDEFTPADIKQAYHNMALELHPDSDQDNAALNAGFEDVKKAYEALRNFCQSGRCSFRQGGLQSFLYIETRGQEAA
ncbi:MAG TPA: hypothetical protein DDW94_10775 [Deltaproteobacteria bacterium]|nr:MAG: hypothetical protein A2Z79_11600 [Deltaproteobacteria bacterium GWA2_55_82]OGQ63514.1 MAG: hypothetical protein A3I81_05785 [Deltaproteobacteria bacterium RIFCSPLOWO2_02_FULL_55_12]OIJ74895.1 MAG: hypothetical protein A2V21_311845 [Deltaproteobacteria bacterium GWC2_55_46]HBG47453.1 hypothetical protein [Deltaproteobacteria bacterium]HCY11469.1 hypothetical protein [Deltaproteobacteria bacterium]